ncbi:MAG: peptidase S41 [Mediterranea sp.]|jgi:hypothetical protein|nr:peptidase S41 [Mediterranea sp.]
MKHITYLLFLFLYLFLNACDDDKNEPKENNDRPETIAWIEDTMREHYFWREEIKKADALNYNATPNAFFTSLLSSKDGKNGNPYSYIENISSTTRGAIRSNYTYGFEFCIVTFSPSMEIGACVLYVLPDSPASGKLKRGDWIFGINDKSLTEESVKTLFGGEAAKFTVANWDPIVKIFYESEDIDIDAARAVEDNPIFHRDIFERPNKKIGYLVYNHFTAGKEDVVGDTTYDDELRKLSNSIFSEVDEFILDLRYNNGGLLTSAQLLCAIFTPFDKLSVDFLWLQYKYNDPSTRVPFKVNETLRNGALTGENLNLKRLYVLVSSMSASSSEAVINLLDPFMDVIIIGETTVGKNVGASEYESDDKTWKMHPIICQILNADKFADYTDGFQPHYPKGEAFDYDKDGYIVDIPVLYELGNENERLLKIALELIDNSYTGDQGTRSLRTPISKEKVASSLDRKATNGVVIDIE